MTDDIPEHHTDVAINFVRMQRELEDARASTFQSNCPGDANAQNAIEALDRVIEHAEKAQKMLEGP